MSPIEKLSRVVPSSIVVRVCVVSALTVEDFRAIHPAFDSDVASVCCYQSRSSAAPHTVPLLILHFPRVFSLFLSFLSFSLLPLPISLHSSPHSSVSLPTSPKLWNFENSVDQYNAYGGTGSESVQLQILRLRRRIDELATL